MIVSDQGKDFIKGFEKCRLVVYADAAGRPTIGWGRCLPPGSTVQTCTAQDAEDWFEIDLARVVYALSMFISREPTQQQLDALASLAYNEGPNAIGHSTLMLHFNRGEIDDAGNQFARWRYVRDPKNGGLVESAGLVKRREAERRIFLDGVYDADH